jgi:hypothetical protein
MFPRGFHGPRRQAMAAERGKSWASCESEIAGSNSTTKWVKPMHNLSPGNNLRRSTGLLFTSVPCREDKSLTKTSPSINSRRQCRRLSQRSSRRMATSRPRPSSQGNRSTTNSRGSAAESWQTSLIFTAEGGKGPRAGANRADDRWANGPYGPSQIIVERRGVLSMAANSKFPKGHG